MSKDLSTKKQNTQDPDKGLPGPLNVLYWDQCDVCGRGVGEDTGYSIDGPHNAMLRVYCSAKCLATVVKPDLVKILAQEVAENLKAKTPK